MAKTASKAAGRKRTSQKPADVVTDVLVVAVLDRSGSMSSIRDETIELWNRYRRDLETDDSGETWVTLIGFDDRIEVWHDTAPVADVPLLTVDTYVPRAMTALNDSIAVAVRKADEKLAELGPDVKVLIPVLTDGYENASREFPGIGNPALKALIEQKEAEGNFTFVWLSADPTATVAQIAADYGVSAGNVAYWSKTGQSVETTTDALAAGTRTLRAGARGATGPTGEPGAAGATGSFLADTGYENDLRDGKGKTEKEGQ